MLRFLSFRPLPAYGGVPIGKNAGEDRRCALRCKLRGALHGNYAFEFVLDEIDSFCDEYVPRVRKKLPLPLEDGKYGDN